ncbi:MAG: DUF3429 domain-containing protein [Alphaproteobacteria bacterium]|nr:DUF3429 domain-containing protein [Alphaproteobacteria bacterium]
MPRSPTPIPAGPLIYGLLGLIPFVAPPVLALARPGLASSLLQAQAIYAALILSFLGGARWGFAVLRDPPPLRTVSLSMLPTLAALSLLLTPERLAPEPLSPERLAPWRLGALALALALHGLWDARGGAGPSWYPRLRAGLTAVACLGLLAGAGLAHG